MIAVSDSDVTSAVAKRKLSKQAEALLLRLRAGAIRTDELMGWIAQYSARFADLRKAGYHIECTGDPDVGCWYRLVSPDPVLREYTVPTEVRVYGREPETLAVVVWAASWEQAKQSARFTAATARAVEDCHGAQ